MLNLVVSISLQRVLRLNLNEGRKMPRQLLLRLKSSLHAYVKVYEPAQYLLGCCQIFLSETLGADTERFITACSDEMRWGLKKKSL